MKCVQGRELDDDEPEPPVPPGLGSLSRPLKTLADFLRLDPDLLAATAEASPALQPKIPSTATLRRLGEAQPELAKDEIILRLLRGDEAHLRAELLRRLDGAAGCSDVGELRRTLRDTPSTLTEVGSSYEPGSAVTSEQQPQVAATTARRGSPHSWEHAFHNRLAPQARRSTHSLDPVSMHQCGAGRRSRPSGKARTSWASSVRASIM